MGIIRRFKKLNLEKEAIDKITNIKNLYGSDNESIHIEADEVLCDLLLKLGYEDIVKTFRLLDKWYS